MEQDTKKWTEEQLAKQTIEEIAEASNLATQITSIAMFISHNSKADISVNYDGHVKVFDVRCYFDGWSKELQGPAESYSIYLEGALDVGKRVERLTNLRNRLLQFARDINLVVKFNTTGTKCAGTELTVTTLAEAQEKIDKLQDELGSLKEQYKDLKEDNEKAVGRLNCLDALGVDNWGGYGEAMRLYREEFEKEEK